MSIQTYASKFVLLMSLAAFVGCGDAQSTSGSLADQQQSDHGAEGHGVEEPATFDEALASVSSMKTEICKAFADGTPDAVHDTLHEVGHTLEALPGLAAKVDGVAADQLAKIEAAVEQLFDGFSQLDDTMHGGDEVDIEVLDQQLTDAINELKKAVE